MISAVSWVPKGVSKAVPSSAEPPSKEEVESLKGRALQSQYISCVLILFLYLIYFWRLHCYYTAR